MYKLMALVALLILTTGVSSREFYKIEPSKKSRLIYVSSSTGKDNSKCTITTPCKTISAGAALLRSGKPDHLYLKAGDSWQNEVIRDISGGLSEAEPMVISAYGSGPRPMVSSNSSFLFASNKEKTISNLVVKGLHIKNRILNFMHTNKNLVFDDNLFEESGLYVHHANAKIHPSNVLVINNIFTGNSGPGTSHNENTRPSNMYISHVDKMILRGNVFDYGGWHPTIPGRGANMYVHNVYWQFDSYPAVFEDNIVVRAANLGLHGRSGGRIENNLFVENSVSVQCNYREHHLPPPQRCEIFNNVIIDGRSIFSKGVDPCRPDETYKQRLCSKAIWGISIADPLQGEFILRDNLIARGNHKLDDGIKGLEIIGLNILVGKTPKEVGDKDIKLDFDKSNMVYNWGKNYNVPKKLLDPTRSVADFAKEILGLEPSLDAYMDFLKSRPAGSTDPRYSADLVNSYIKAGFGMTTFKSPKLN